MSIIVDEGTKLVVSGLTGREGSFHGLRNRGYGTDLVAGVTPGKGGQDVEGVPVFDTIREAVDERGANTSMIFVPARFAAAAIDEAIEAGVGTVIAITEGIPVLDMLRVYWRAKEAGVRLIGPNCPGVLSPGKANVGIIPAQFFERGPIGDVSKSEDDPETELIVMVGEIGGDAEERAADFIAESVFKPVVAYIAGFTAPPGKQMGHAGAIISGSSGTAEAKKEALEARGVRVGRSPTETAQLAVEVLQAAAPASTRILRNGSNSAGFAARTDSGTGGPPSIEPTRAPASEATSMPAAKSQRERPRSKYASTRPQATEQRSTAAAPMRRRSRTRGSASTSTPACLRRVVGS
jgi:succinyl-CoA synthetase alpha subunit